MACHQVEVDEIDLASKVRFEKEQKNTRRTKVDLKTNMTLESGNHHMFNDTNNYIFKQWIFHCDVSLFGGVIVSCG